jgi:hypothetical protein
MTGNWLVETLSAPATNGACQRSSVDTASPNDERFAAQVDTAAAGLLARSGKPQQVTKERLLQRSLCLSRTRAGTANDIHARSSGLPTTVSRRGTSGLGGCGGHTPC